MRIQDARGRPEEEITLILTHDEVSDLLVAASRLEGTETDHELLRDRAGTTIGIYLRDEGADLLERHVDWWVGPLILIVVLLLLVGAFTVSRGLINLIF